MEVSPVGDEAVEKVSTDDSAVMSGIMPKPVAGDSCEVNSCHLFLIVPPEAVPMQ